MSSAFGRLVLTETRLFLREPVSLVFVLAFPPLVVLVLGGVFDPDDPAFGGANPSDYYVAAYIGVVLAAVGVVMLPVHLASYREQGVLRRFRASHFPSWALPAAWAVVATLLSVVGFVFMLATAQLAYGVPAVDRLGATVLATLLATLTFVSIGILLGLALPTARAAQGVGLALFLPSFLLGGGGPPPEVMPAAMRGVAQILPMTHAVHAIQHSWLSVGGPVGIRFAALVGICATSTVGWICLARRATTP